MLVLLIVITCILVSLNVVEVICLIISLISKEAYCSYYQQPVVMLKISQPTNVLVVSPLNRMVLG